MCTATFYTNQTRPLHLWSLIQRQGIKCGSLVLIFAPVSPPCGAGDTPDSVSVMLIVEMNIERRSNCAGVKTGGKRYPQIAEQQWLERLVRLALTRAVKAAVAAPAFHFSLPPGDLKQLRFKGAK